jgi:hypothetical protein
MMAELGLEVSSAGVARRYLGVIDTLVMDHTDRDEATRVEACCMRAMVTNTIMQTTDDKERLALEIVALIDGGDGR